MDTKRQIEKKEKEYFYQGYARVVIYMNNHSDANKAKDFVCKDKFYLGAWFSYFRGKWSRNELPPKTVYRLELLGITRVDAEDGFNQMLVQFNSYVSKNKSYEIPQNYKTEDGSMLGAWVCRQKMCYQSLPVEKQEILKSAGVIS